MPDTIAAIATGGGKAAIGIIRVSGSEAIRIADEIFHINNGKRLIDAQSGRMQYGEIYNSRLTDNETSSKTNIEIDVNNYSNIHKRYLIDKCMCAVYHAPNSYTGEDSVEFFCHGSPIVLSEVLKLLIKHGVRQALPGEFTKRAFLNGKMDLMQAEAVIDLIDSETPFAAQNAVGQLQGKISTSLESIYSTLVDIMAHFHAVLDYPDEDIDDFKLANYLSALENAQTKLSRLMASYSRGRILRGGIKTAIIGQPNTGKSSLLNALLGYDRAIVTGIAGTTRDTIEEKALIGNTLLRLIDTAGIRKSNDVVEKLGVERSLSALENADLIFLVIDGSEEMRDCELDVLNSVPQNVPIILIVNKSDLPQKIENLKLRIESKELGVDKFSIQRVSALTGEGLDNLEAQIQMWFPEPDSQSIGEIITNARQFDTISRAKASISEAITAISESYTPDIVLVEVEAALTAIGEVNGKSMREDIISRIFERFCVGK